MKTKYLLIFFVVLSFANIVFCNETDKKSLKFIENKGQWVNNVLFKTNIKTGSAFIEKDGIVFNLSDRNKGCSHDHKGESNSCESKKIINNHAFKLRLINSNNNSLISTKNENREYYNYFIGNDKSKWASNVKAYSEITYNQIYNNIDWKIYSEEGNIKHDFIVKKGGNIEDISLEYIGLNDIYIKKHNLILSTSIGELIELRPIVYQIINGEKIKIDANFILNGNIIKYKIDQYNKDYELIIDPILIFSTYSGSTADNWGFTATYDRKGNGYLAGITSGTGYPTTTGAYQENFNGGNWDISISKFNPNGTALIYSTYIGSSASEMPHSMIVNEFGELVIFGTTGGSNFPITYNAFQSTFNGGEYVNYDGSILFAQGCDIFVSKLNPSGNILLGSTYVGGSSNDGLNFLPRYPLYKGNDSLYANYGDGARGELITDDQNNIYVGSCTYSYDFPTTLNAFQRVKGGKQDGVVFKLDYSLSTMLFSSFIGGSEDDAVFSVDTDKEYKLYVTGGTVSHNFPTTSGTFSPSHNGGSTDAFLSLISYNGTHILASTYFGSNAFDNAFFVRTDRFNNPYIYGQTKAQGSTLVHNALYNIPNSGQFFAKFSPDLKSRIWSTVWGSGNGKKNISPTAFSIDICGRIYASGWAGGPTFGELSTNNLQTTPDAFQSITDGEDFYIMSIPSNASYLDFATFIGENNSYDHVDGGTSRFDRFSNLYQTVCASCGGTDGFPTTINAYSNLNNSNNCNAALFKFNVHNDFPVADFESPDVGCAPIVVNFVNNSRGTSFLWDFGDGSTTTQTNPSHTYNNGGIYNIRLIAYQSNGCSIADTITKTLVVLSDTTRVLPDINTCPNQPVQIGIPPISSNNLSIRWIPTSAVTDDSITNPFAIVSTTTNLCLLLSNGICTDTIKQRVVISPISINLQDTITTCNSPYNLTVSSSTGSLIRFAYDRNFNNMISFDTSINTTPIFLNGSEYIYVKISKDGCLGVDSVWFDFTGTIINLETKDVKCAGESTGYVIANVSKGVPPYNFQWSNGQTGINLDTIINIGEGNYQLNVIDSRGCNSAINFTINAPDTLKALEEVVNNPCIGACVGSINIIPSGGHPPYNILWDNGSKAFSINNLCSKTYHYTITDSELCTKSDSVTITNNGNYEINILKVDNNCSDECIGTATAYVSSGTPPFIYRWSNSQNTQTINNLCTGNYSVEVEDSVGCKASKDVSIIDLDLFSDFWVMASAVEIYDGQVITLSSKQIPNMLYQWMPANVYSPNSPITKARPLTTTTYTAYVTDEKGCNAQDSVTIKVNVVICDKPNIFIPNIFTPNNDGKNDVIKVSGDYVRSINFCIFDRWGEMVFSTKDINEGWDGKFRSKDCIPGVYFYRLEVECEAERKYSSSGDITLIR
ncbi:MAG: hypothetical protein H6Q15_1444 [Bacteroidetes bacterium]|nr:hypothetical protein [Bacteroidota bacterium]